MALTKREFLLPPGVCIICEQTPDAEADIVDTNKTLVTGFPYHLEGRKYVCAPCIESLGAEIGLISDAKAKEADRRREEAEFRLTATSQRIEEIAGQLLSGSLEDAVLKHPALTRGEDLPAEEQKSGLEAAVEAGTDPGAVSVFGAAAPTEADNMPTPGEQVVEPTEPHDDSIEPVVETPEAPVSHEESVAPVSAELKSAVEREAVEQSKEADAALAEAKAELVSLQENGGDAGAIQDAQRRVDDAQAWADARKVETEKSKKDDA